MKALDRILLEGLRFYGYHGVLPEERRRGQVFEVDVELGLDLAPAAKADDLAATVDYARACQVIREVLEGPPCNLLEAVAEKVARALHRTCGVPEVRVRVRKLSPPVPGEYRALGVEIHRLYPEPKGRQ